MYFILWSKSTIKCCIQTKTKSKKEDVAKHKHERPTTVDYFLNKKNNKNQVPQTLYKNLK